MATKKPAKKAAKKAPAKAGAAAKAIGGTVDADRVPALFNAVGDFSPEGVKEMADICKRLMLNGPQLLQSASMLMERVKLAPGLNDRDRLEIEDCVFAVLERSSAIWAAYESLYEITSFRLAQRRKFSAAMNARKSAAKNPKVQAMRTIEAEWDAAGRPDIGPFSEGQATRYQLKGTDLNKNSIVNALRKYRSGTSR